MLVSKDLQVRAKRAVRFIRRKHDELWIAGFKAGRKSGIQYMADAIRRQRRKLHSALREANLQHERHRKAMHEANISRLKWERKCAEMRVLENKRDEREYRRAAMMESRVPATNGGFSR